MSGENRKACGERENIRNSKTFLLPRFVGVGGTDGDGAANEQPHPAKSPGIVF